MNQIFQCRDKGWPMKAFIVVAKRVYNTKKAKKAVANDTEAQNEEVISLHIVEKEVEGHHDEENDEDDGKEGGGLEAFDDEEDCDEEDEKGEGGEHDDIAGNEGYKGVVNELICCSKKRNARTKKTKREQYVCDADREFRGMHGPCDLSDLGCNDFKNKKLMLKLNEAAKKQKRL